MDNVINIEFRDNAKIYKIPNSTHRGVLANHLFCQELNLKQQSYKKNLILEIAKDISLVNDEKKCGFLR